MILGVLVRDVDSGHPEREPIGDPTGWGGVPCTRPSETPSISSGADSATKNTNTYTDRTKNIYSNSNPNPMSFMSNAHLEFLEEGNTTVLEQTPRPNRYMFESEDSRGPETLLLDGALSTEPESLSMDSGRNSMTTASNARSQTYPLEPRQLQQQFPPSPLHVTQPKPIPPPRVTANLQRIYRQHQGSSSASTPNSSTTSFSLNNSMNYGPGGGKMTELEKRRYELQMRVYRARTQMPSHIVLRVFREPSECVEVEEVMRREGLK